MPENYGAKTDTPAQLAVASIGQGHSLTSAGAISGMTSGLATGTWREPSLYKNTAQKTRSTPLIGQGEITQQSLDLIREGMIAVTQAKGGTGHRAAVEGITVAGKTATAQTGKIGMNKYIAWFTGYAPAEAPKYSVTIQLEQASSGGRDAAPIAAQLFKFMLKK